MSYSNDKQSSNTLCSALVKEGLMVFFKLTANQYCVGSLTSKLIFSYGKLGVMINYSLLGGGGRLRFWKLHFTFETKQTD